MNSDGINRDGEEYSYGGVGDGYSYRYYENHAGPAPEDACRPAEAGDESGQAADDGAGAPTVRCPDCGGSGSVLLLISTRPCERCGDEGKV